MYVQKHFKEDSKQAALEMVADIRREFDSILDEIDWMDPRTKKRAKAKAAGIVEHIGYPPELLNAQKLNDLYEGLELNSTHYLGNALNMTVFGTNYAFSKLREKVRGFKAHNNSKCPRENFLFRSTRPTGSVTAVLPSSTPSTLPWRTPSSSRQAFCR